MSFDTSCQMPICTLLNISNLYADDDATSMTTSRNTRSYTLRSVPSSPGRSFLKLESRSQFLGPFCLWQCFVVLWVLCIWSCWVCSGTPQLQELKIHWWCLSYFWYRPVLLQSIHRRTFSLTASSFKMSLSDIKNPVSTMIGTDLPPVYLKWVSHHVGDMQFRFLRLRPEADQVSMSFINSAS